MRYLKIKNKITKIHCDKPCFLTNTLPVSKCINYGAKDKIIT